MHSTYTYSPNYYLLIFHNSAPMQLSIHLKSGTRMSMVGCLGTILFILFLCVIQLLSSQFDSFCDVWAAPDSLDNDAFCKRKKFSRFTDWIQGLSDYKGYDYDVEIDFFF